MNFKAIYLKEVNETSQHFGGWKDMISWFDQKLDIFWVYHSDVL